MNETRIEPRAVSRQEAADALTVSIDIFDRLVAEGRIQVVRIGSGRNARVIVPVKSLDEFLELELAAGGLEWFERSATTEKAPSTTARKTRAG